MCAGMALIKASRFPLAAFRIQQCHTGFQPGGVNALRPRKVAARIEDPSTLPTESTTGDAPAQKVARVVKAKHVIVILNIVLVEQRVELIQLTPGAPRTSGQRGGRSPTRKRAWPTCLSSLISSVSHLNLALMAMGVCLSSSLGLSA